MKNKNEYMKKYMLKRYYQRKEEATSILGGECLRCGVTENLNFHHTKDKLFNISKLWSISKKKFYSELRKCVLLCEDCHKKEHKSKYLCGTPQRYWRGCRCKDCTEANTKYSYEYKHRTKE